VSGVHKGEVIQWRGVPYAAAPTGDRRFRPPEAPSSWDDVRDGSRFGPAAPQSTSPLQGLVGGQPPDWSEDCLYLNVFAPAVDRSEPLPVMVWVHGGAFVGGSGSTGWYDGSRFAASGQVVLVTLNYRLGALGFLELGATGDDRDRSAGNAGILDQLAALRWVSENISSFGGDPTRVTVFGESAGAMSIGVMLAMPAAQGLFHQAILQSGAASTYRSKAEAEAITERTLAAAGATVEQLRTAAVEQILAAQAAVTRGGDAATYLAYRPVVDGVDLPEPPDHALAAGRGFDGAVMIGTNRDEMTLFLAFDPAAATLSDEQLDQRATAMLGPSRWARLAEHYRVAHGAPTARLAAVATDVVFRIPAIGLAESPRRAPTWMYRFDWPSSAAGGRLGATHGMDIPFVWDLVDLPGVELFTGQGPGRHDLARAMHGAWLAFATGGDPSTPWLPWPAYSPPGRATMLFDAQCRVVDDPDGVPRSRWDGF
jgi:para-nitrobenzyl esterase